ncbi:hypothetical protein [Scytonema sp. NUACC26]|uniref:hypothetical protein n=1 Tax=Scytonema sp. NUACC26 TaxID=3140176 RepID=UPI0038B31E90
MTSDQGANNLVTHDYPPLLPLCTLRLCGLQPFGKETTAVGAQGIAPLPTV